MTIGHAAVYVRDLEGARAFFETYFQAASGPEYHNPDTHFRSYFLAFDGGARLELMTRPGLGAPPAEPGVGWAHLALSVGSRAAVDALTGRLARLAGLQETNAPVSPRTLAGRFSWEMVPRADIVVQPETFG